MRLGEQVQTVPMRIEVLDLAAPSTVKPRIGGGSRQRLVLDR